MFIIRKIILLLIFNFLLSFSNFIYDEDDWFIIKNLGQIQSFTEDNYNKIIIGTINGIFIYDKLTDELIYDIYLTRGLPSINIKNIFYDKRTDHIWVYHNEGVSFKPLSSFSYHHLSRSDLIDQGLLYIDDIGGSDSYVWFRRDDHIIAINSFSGKFVQISESSNEINDIKWGSSMFGYSGESIDLSRYYISDTDWSIGYRINNVSNQYIDFNVFFDEYGDQVIPTVLFNDSDYNTWLGTDRGFIFSAWGRSNKLESIKSGLMGNIISGLFIDKTFNWWFYDSHYKRINKFKDITFYDKKNDFLTFWNERAGIWKTYKTNETIQIQSSDINDINEFEKYILIGTMYGLLRYDGHWELLDTGDGLHDNSILKIERYENHFIILTSGGINEINVNPFSVIPNSFEDFKKIEVLDIKVVNQDSIFICNDKLYRDIDVCKVSCTNNCDLSNIKQMIVSTVRGLVEIDLNTNLVTYLSAKSCSQLEVQELNLFCLDNGVWSLDLLNPEKEFKQVLIDNDIRNFTLSDNYIWVNLTRKARLMNLRNGESWYYNEGDGIQGNNIYEIGNNGDWVWFLSDKGISLYNWRKFHAN